MIRNKTGRVLLALMLAGLLTACGGGKNEEIEPEPTQEPVVETIAPVQPPEPEPEPEPVYPYQNPLTGEGCMEDIAGQRPIAIMLNNHKKAVPQAGVSQADVIYEIPAEGGITRMLAVFQSVEDVGEIGTVRSARDYYVSLALGHDALYLHAGGSPQAYTYLKNWGMAAFDCVNGPYEGTLYWRDASRKASAGREHSVMTSGSTILELMPTYGRRMEHKEGFEVGWEFTEEIPEGEPANKMTLRYSDYKTGVFTYDEESEQYLIEEYGQPYVDANTGEQVGVTNVLVLYTDVRLISGDKAGRLNVRTTGTGSGILLRKGVVTDIQWKRASDTDRLSFYDGNGQEVALSVGSSYINVVDDSNQAVWE